MTFRAVTARRPGLVCVARIGAPHGVRGEVRLWPFTADPLAVTGYGVLTSRDGTRSFEVERLRPGKDFLIAKLKGVDDRHAAEAVRNEELYVDRARLPEPEAEEFYHADLVGLAAEDDQGRPLGRVVAIYNFGAGDLIEIRPEAGGATVLVPFRTETVPEVDLGGSRIVVVMPPPAPEDAS